MVDADLKSYFDTKPHEKLMQRVREKIADGRRWTNKYFARARLFPLLQAHKLAWQSARSATH